MSLVNVLLGISDDIGLASVTNNYSSSSNESTPRVWTSNETHHEVKVKQCNTKRGIFFLCYFHLIVYRINLRRKMCKIKNHNAQI